MTGSNVAGRRPGHLSPVRPGQVVVLSRHTEGQDLGLEPGDVDRAEICRTQDLLALELRRAVVGGELCRGPDLTITDIDPELDHLLLPAFLEVFSILDGPDDDRVIEQCLL